MLKDAYADGRIDGLEFDSRIDQVLAATTRKDLNQAFYGPVKVPTPPTAPETRGAQPPVRVAAPGQQPGRGAAAFAHFSVFLLWLFGPGVVFAVSPAGSYARREAAKAFNFQVVSAIVLVPLSSSPASPASTCSTGCCPSWASAGSF